MLRNNVLYSNITLGCCSGKHKCAGLNLIGDDHIFCTVEFLNSLDPDNISTCALDICTHTVKEVGHINNVGFLGSVLENCLTLSQTSCHHNIDGRTYADNIEINMTSNKLISVSLDDTVLNVDICTKSLESLDVLVHRTKSYATSSGRNNSRMIVFTKKCTQKIIRCSYLLDVVILYNDAIYLRSIDLDRM